MKIAIFALVLIGTGAVTATTQSAYVGEASNEIKSLSPGEVKSLLQGDGMGFAKVAELNRFPGPRHVLDLKEELHLSEYQIAKTNLIFVKMQERAISLGTQLVEYERELDELFSSVQISTSTLDSLLLKIGETESRLRGAHLHAHLQMKEILSPHQVMMYDHLRGYSTAGGNHEHTHR